ncbi:MAG: cache and HAMP domain-containing protein, partial [Caldilineaceae bacterium]|nr:cache and HAMP domain-containing protein [Caldilineaceae bacterium]
MTVYSNLRIGVKLIIIFVALLVVAVGAITFINYNSVGGAFSEATYESLDRLSETEAIIVLQDITKQVELMTVLAGDSILEHSVETTNTAYTGTEAEIIADIERMDEAWIAAEDDAVLIQERLQNEVAEELVVFAAEFAGYVELFVTDVYGAVVASTARTGDYYQADEGWWQNAYADGQGATYMSQPEFDESSGILSVNIAIPVYGHDSDGVIGVLRATYDVRELVARVNDHRIGETGRSMLYLPGDQRFDEAGRIVDVTESARLPAIHDVFEHDLGGIPSLVVTLPVADMTDQSYLADLGWMLVVHQSTEEAYAAATSVLQQSLLAALVILILAGAVVWFVARSLARPIERLRDLAKAVASGDLNVSMDYSARDEVGQLVDEFQQMIAYQQQMADAGGQLAQGDLDLSVTARSEQDVLGNAFQQ